MQEYIYNPALFLFFYADSFDKLRKKRYNISK